MAFCLRKVSFYNQGISSKWMQVFIEFKIWLAIFILPLIAPCNEDVKRTHPTGDGMF